ncbi:hypothetical protein PspLS_10270 [Pyricularia sp. CBS 133598]|nr:hypothetical protein PspLS_10270 [Pyricularia sp. CBS 133598]
MTAPPKLTKPAFEHHPTGFGVGTTRPRISWRFLSDETTAPRWQQTAYEIEVTRRPDTTGQESQPHIYRVESSDSVLVPWPKAEKSLSSRDSATVRVRAQGQPDHSQTEWSDPATVEAALLHQDDWRASFVSAAPSKPFQEADSPLRPVRFHKAFSVPNGSGVSRARLYLTALGLYEVYVNGVRACDDCLAPGWTSYNHRLAYRVLDVSSLLCTDGRQNSICVEVGEGWYAGRIGLWGGRRFIYGDEVAVLAQLEIMLHDGTETVVVSDDSWSCTPSSIITSEIYNGEVCDLRQEDPVGNWATSIVDSADRECFSPTKMIPWIKATLYAPDAPPVRVTQEIRPVEIFLSKSGKTIVDFGQNLVGRLMVKSLPNLAAGTSVSFRHAEVMEHGELGVRPLKLAKCSDKIISSGAPIIDWSPRFTYHGFRYVEVEGWPALENKPLPGVDDLVALVIHTDMQRRGFFNCSNASINKLHENVVWSMRGNFLSLPTDCPQRDERLGWTGDLQVFAPTATFLYDTVGILGSWLQDLAAEQMEESRGGVPPVVCPEVIPLSWPKNMPQAIWDDVVVLAPDVLHTYSGDLDLLERQFPSMVAWLEKGVDRGPDGLWKFDVWQFGDWLDPSAPPEEPGLSTSDSVFVADAYLVRVTETLARVCSLLGKTELAHKYDGDARQLKGVFHNRYVTNQGNITCNTQTGLALAVHHGLYRSPEDLRMAAAMLTKLVRAAKFKIATGFAGTPIITHALTRIANPQLAYRMLLETSRPSWMYPLSMGATTVWERWDSMLPDGSINPGHMTSFNHYALGSVADWLHGTVGGIAPLEPGWKVIKVRPVPGGNLTAAEVGFDGPYGWVGCKWKLEHENHADTARVGRLFEMELVVPPNSTAMVTLPSELRSDPVQEQEPNRMVGPGKHTFSCVYNVGEWPPKRIMPPFIPFNGPETIAFKIQIEQYLDHIGFHSVDPGTLPPPTLATLTEIQARHIARVPFENISLRYSAKTPPLSLDLQDLFNKIVVEKRGGYCMEVNALLSAVMRGLRFDVLNVGGRIKKADDSGRFSGLSHMLNIVAIDGQRYQVDVGFGEGGPPMPVPLPSKDDAEPRHDFVRIPPSSMGRVEWRNIPRQHLHADQRVWVYSTREDGQDWRERYSFVDAECFPEDYEVFNFHTMMHPSSFFVNNVVAVRTVPEGEADGEVVLPCRGGFAAKGTWVLFNDEIKRTIAGKEEIVEKLQSEDQRIKGLDKYFGIKVSPEQAAAMKDPLGS